MTERFSWPVLLKRARQGFSDAFLRWSPPPEQVVAPREWERFPRVRKVLGSTLMPWILALAVFWITAFSTDPWLGPPGSVLVGLLAALPLLYLRVDLLVTWRLAAVGSVLTLPFFLNRAGYWGYPAASGVIVLCLSILVATLYDRPVALWIWAAVLAMVTIASPFDIISFVLLVGFLAIVTDAVRNRRLAASALVAEQEVSGLERARRVGFEERTRIARELHDVVAHHMSIVAVRAETAPYRVEGLSDELREEFAEISSAARTSLNEIRSLLGVLRSDESGRAPQPGLDQLDAMIEATRSAGVEVEVNIRGDRRPLRPAVELAAYRILQESLSNVARHAPGATAEVWIEFGDDHVGLVVANPWDGNAGEPGHGIIGMTERATAVGGTVEARRRPDGRFVVEATLPVEA